MTGPDTNVIVRYVVQDDPGQSALAWRGCDFADALIGESSWESGCRTTVTLDRGAAALPGFELVS